MKIPAIHRDPRHAAAALLFSLLPAWLAPASGTLCPRGSAGSARPVCYSVEYVDNGTFGVDESADGDRDKSDPDPAADNGLPGWARAELLIPKDVRRQLEGSRSGRLIQRVSFVDRLSAGASGSPVGLRPASIRVIAEPFVSGHYEAGPSRQSLLRVLYSARPLGP